MTHVLDGPSVEAAVAQALARHGASPGPLLQVLHAVQEAIGCVPDESVPLIADGLNLSRAEVHGIVTFYHHFRRTPPGLHVMHLCRAEACQAMGARALEAHATATLGIGFHETTPDGRVTLLPVACLGNCALSPAVLIAGELHGRVTPQRFDAILAELRAEGRGRP